MACRCIGWKKVEKEEQCQWWHCSFVLVVCRSRYSKIKEDMQTIRFLRVSVKTTDISCVSGFFVFVKFRVLMPQICYNDTQ